MAAQGRSSIKAVSTCPSSLNSRACQGPIGAISEMSAPATKAFSPAPVRISARASAQSRTACVSSRSVLPLRALSDLGRLTVMVAMGPSRSTRTFSKVAMFVIMLWLIPVKTALRLPSQPAGVDVLAEDGRRPVLVLAQALVQHFRDVEAGVQARAIGHRQPPHRHVGAQLHGGVDVLGGSESFLQGEAGLVEHRDENSINYKSRHVLREHGGLAHPLGQRARHRVRLVAGLRAADDLHQ